MKRMQPLRLWCTLRLQEAANTMYLRAQGQLAACSDTLSRFGVSIMYRAILLTERYWYCRTRMKKKGDLELLLASHMNSYRHACNRVHISAPNVSYRHALHMHCMQTHNSRGCIRHRCIRITHSVLPLHAPRPARICLELLPRAATCCHTCITSGMHTIGVHTTMTPTAYILL